MIMVRKGVGCVRIAHFGNMANDGFCVVEALQEIGVDAQLYVEKYAHVTGLPQWEVSKFILNEVGDPYKPDWEALNKGFEKPEWLHYLEPNRGFLLLGRKLSRTRQAYKEMKKHDLVIAHTPFSMQAYLFKKHVNYIPFEAGLIRKFSNYAGMPHKRFVFWLLKKSYQYAKTILLTNPDTIDLAHEHGIRWVFTPFAINMERYKPLKVDGVDGYEHVITCFSRQNWAVKGQHKLIKAFARFLKEERESLLLMASWGRDVDKSRQLITTLGIDGNVLWLPLMSKPLLVELINRSTVIADQFNLGSSGTAGLEAMACGKPLIINLSTWAYERVYSEFPIVLNARTSEGIYHALRFCAHKKAREGFGELSREWVDKHHNALKVAKLHEKIYEEVIER